ncbi:MAG: hypothetical protein MI723_08285 [Caulobacterales bacterium]|nr:hypothetical protein [Caulobacterales bacterium]
MSAQYRAAYAPDTDGFAQRLHYQRSINGALRWRIVGQTRRNDETNIDFDYVQGELLWEISPDDRDWRTGLRFDGRVRDHNRPGRFAVNWTNQIALTPRLRARALFISSVDVGENAGEGVSLQTRGRLGYALEGGRRLGVEMFNSYGSTDDLPDFEDQRHTLGPFATTPLTETISAYAGVQLGLTEPAAEADWRLWLTRSF